MASRVIAGNGVALHPTDGSVFAWGMNQYGQLGNDSTSDSDNPVRFEIIRTIVDPKDPNKIYKPGGGLIASNDGGKSFSGIGGGGHGDWHDVWINPANTDHLIAGKRL